jgi:hypothetical protein
MSCYGQEGGTLHILLRLNLQLLVRGFSTRSLPRHPESRFPIYPQRNRAPSLCNNQEVLTVSSSEFLQTQLKLSSFVQQDGEQTASCHRRRKSLKRRSSKRVECLSTKQRRSIYSLVSTHSASSAPFRSNLHLYISILARLADRYIRLRNCSCIQYDQSPVENPSAAYSLPEQPADDTQVHMYLNTKQKSLITPTRSMSGLHRLT